MQIAQAQARRLSHEHVGTEHILLGLVEEGSGVAANVLKNLDVDVRKIRHEIERLVAPGLEGSLPAKLSLSPRAKNVCEYAKEESRVLHHNYIGTEHLLLGLLRVEDGVAAQVLMNLGLTLEDVRAQVTNLLGQECIPDLPELKAIDADITRLQGERARIIAEWRKQNEGKTQPPSENQ